MRKLCTRDTPSMKGDNIWQWLLASSEISPVFKWIVEKDRWAGPSFSKRFLKVTVGPKGWLQTDFFVIKKKKNCTWLHLF